MTEPSSMVERASEAVRLKAIERGHPVHPTIARHLAVAAIEAARERSPTRRIVDRVFSIGAIVLCVVWVASVFVSDIAGLIR